MSHTNVGRGPARPARRAADSPWLERAARVGLVARGVVYILMGVLAAQVAFGDSGEKASQTGALQEIAKQPFGEVMLWLVAIGFAGYGLWQLGEALWGHHAVGRTRTRKRVESAGRAAAYLFLTAVTAKIAIDGRSGGGSGGEAISARVMGAPGGQFIVGAVGVAIIAISAVLAWRGFKADFAEDLELGELDTTARKVVVGLGRTGHVARAAVTALFGVVVVSAAISFDPEKARGIDAAIKELASQPYGPALLVVAGAGLVCFGIYSFLEVRYRRL